MSRAAGRPLAATVRAADTLGSGTVASVAPARGYDLRPDWYRAFMLPSPERIIVFARFQEPGKVKTRLIPALGADQAAALHEALTRRTLAVSDQYRTSRRCDVELRFAGGDRAQMKRLFGQQVRYVAQQGADLGARLDAAVREAFSQGAKRVLVVGTDCPELSSQLFAEASDALQRADVVLGPAVDGGYYLIALRAYRPELFQGIDWGTARVLDQTLAAAGQIGWTTRQLRPLPDIDRPEDLLVCRRLSGELSRALPAVRPGILSVVIPTLNEEPCLERTLRPLLQAENVETIVADGGSSDATVDIAKRYGARVVSTHIGRGRQMNAGAAIASGEVLLFLHADTLVPDEFPKQIRQTLAQRGACAGAFRLGIGCQHRALRIIEWGANLRSRFLQLPYGDQGLFLRSELFYQLGGFRNWPLMEDFEFCRRLHRHGRIRLAPTAVTTSPRRWLRRGVVRTTMTHQVCVAGYLLGISPRRLATWYSLPEDAHAHAAARPKQGLL